MKLYHIVLAVVTLTLASCGMPMSFSLLSDHGKATYSTKNGLSITPNGPFQIGDTIVEVHSQK
jgi:hypothetical protein